MIAAIIQARTGSKRFPYKVLKKIRHDPLIKYQIERVKKAKYLNSVIVATTMNKKDDSIVRICKKNSTNYFRGSEKNVLKVKLVVKFGHSVWKVEKDSQTFTFESEGFNTRKLISQFEKWKKDWQTFTFESGNNCQIYTFESGQ